SVSSPGSTAVTNPTGTLTFTDSFNGQLATLGQPTLLTSNNSVISISVSTLAVGTHLITASYSGDGNFLPSRSAGLTQEVDPPPAAPMTTTVSLQVLAPALTTANAPIAVTSNYQGTISFSTGDPDPGVPLPIGNIVEAPTERRDQRRE